MRVLLVDDDAAVRKLVNIILARQKDVEVTECDNGLDALRALSSRQFALAVLDVNMPGMDGLQVLRAIRESPRLRHLPVLMLTGESGEDSVGRAVDYGVTGYITKPLRAGEFSTRVAATLDAVRAAQGRLRESKEFEPLMLERHTVVLIADGDPEFRLFFRNTVGKWCTVEEASSGLAALEYCKGYVPDAVFIGSELGLLNGEVLAEQIRNEKELDRTRVIGVVPSRLMLRAKKQSPFEAVVMRSFVPEVFLEAFGTLLPRQSEQNTLLSAVPDLKLLAIAAGEEALKSMLQRSVDLKSTDPVKRSRGSTTGAILLRVGPDAAPMRLQASIKPASLSRLAERLTAVGTVRTASGDQGILLTVIERIAELLSRELEERGFDVSMAEATIEAPTPTESGRGDGAQEMFEILAVTFDAQGISLSFRIALENAASSSAPQGFMDAPALADRPSW